MLKIWHILYIYIFSCMSWLNTGPKSNRSLEAASIEVEDNIILNEKNLGLWS